MHLGCARPPVLLGEFSKAGPPQRVPCIARPNSPSPVLLPSQREYRVRPDQHVAVNGRREVHAEERVLRIRHRVDQPAHQVPRLGAQRVVLAPERHDPRLGVVAGPLRHSVRLQAGASDQQIARVRLGGATVDQHGVATAVRVAHADDLGAEHQLAASPDVIGERPADGRVVGDGCVRRIQRLTADRIRFQFGEFRRRDHPKVRHAVRHPALVQRCQPLLLVLPDGNDDLAHVLNGDVLVLAVLPHQHHTVRAQLRLERPRFVVQPGMQHAAVVACLMGADGLFLLQNRDRRAGPPLAGLACDCQSDDPAADDDDFVHHETTPDVTAPDEIIAVADAASRRS